MMYCWQHAQWQQIQAMIKQGQLPHALFLHGAKGMGKYEFAKQLAAILLCEQPREFACGQCRGCQLLAAGSHPDFFDLGLLEKSKSIKIEQIRGLTQSLNQTAQRGGYQIAIIHPADAMNTASANALLKTLEEPPGQVLIMLLVEQTGRLPATILSRCQRMNFVTSADDSMQQWLSSQAETNVDSALLLRLAQYAPLYALQLAKQDAIGQRNILLSQLQALRQQQTDPVSVAADFIKQDTALVIVLFISLVNDISRVQLGVSQKFLCHQDRLDDVRKLATALSMQCLQQFLQQLVQLQQLLDSLLNPNLQLQFERILIRWQQLGGEHDH